jgi:hypothetical protein
MPASEVLMADFVPSNEAVATVPVRCAMPMSCDDDSATEFPITRAIAAFCWRKSWPIATM